MEVTKVTQRFPDKLISEALHRYYADLKIQELKIYLDEDSIKFESQKKMRARVITQVKTDQKELFGILPAAIFVKSNEGNELKVSSRYSLRTKQINSLATSQNSLYREVFAFWSRITKPTIIYKPKIPLIRSKSEGIEEINKAGIYVLPYICYSSRADQLIVSAYHGSKYYIPTSKPIRKGIEIKPEIDSIKTRLDQIPNILSKYSVLRLKELYRSVFWFNLNMDRIIITYGMSAPQSWEMIDLESLQSNKSNLVSLFSDQKLKILTIRQSYLENLIVTGLYTHQSKRPMNWQRVFDSKGKEIDRQPQF